ncbi:MAG: flagellar basal body L-ring protein FlgH [Alphaproteobacteria bacterium]|jgi:flagellar L-ring protein precursor FlgH
MRSVRLALACASIALLGACTTADRLSQIGKAPDLTPVRDPTLAPDYVPVSMPMPAPQQVAYEPNSLWRPGNRTFFKDQRAQRIGDILTVNIQIDDKAKVANTSSRGRTNSEESGLPNLLGFESNYGGVLPDAVDPSKLISMNSDSASRGTGSVDRNEQINLTIAAVVTQVMPNGNLVIQGRQEVRVNYEVRELLLGGIVRPEDIANDNTINHTQIAEARISYGGRGQITDVQQPRYGQQLIDVIWPF